MSKAKRGRPPKPPGEGFTHYDYVRMTKAQWERVAEIAKSLGFAKNGGRAAAIRYAIDKIAPLVKTATPTPEKKQ